MATNLWPFTSDKLTADSVGFDVKALLDLRLGAFAMACMFLAGGTYYSAFLHTIDVPFQVIDVSLDTLIQQGSAILLSLVLAMGAAALFMITLRLIPRGTSGRTSPMHFLSVTIILLLAVAFVGDSFGAGDARKIERQEGVFRGYDAEGNLLPVQGKLFLRSGGELYVKNFETGAFYIVKEDSMAFFRVDRVDRENPSQPGSDVTA